MAIVRSSRVLYRWSLPVVFGAAKTEKVLQQCNHILQKRQVRHWTQKTPPTPLKAQLKLHKPDIPIRPVVNNRSAPAYKTAKKLNNILKQHLHLNNYYAINNSTELAQNLTSLTINETTD